MEVIKKKICKEDFINRCNVVDKDGKSLWGKILNDVVISNDDDLLDIGLYYEDYIPYEGEDVSNVPEWNEETHLVLGEIDNIFKVTENGEVKKYVKVTYKNVIPFSIFKDKEDNEKVIIRNRNLMNIHKFLIDFEYSLSYYKKCGNKWVEVDEKYSVENNIEIDDFFSSDEITPVVYELPIIDTSSPDYICKSQYANEFNDLFRLNEKYRYEKLLKNLIDNFMEGKIEESNTTTPYFEIPLLLTQDINSLGIYENNIKQNDLDKYYLGDLVFRFNEDKKITSLYELNKGNDVEYVKISESLINVINESAIYKNLTKEEYNNKIKDKKIFTNDDLYEKDLYEKSYRILIKDNDSYYLPNIIYTTYKGDINNDYWVEVVNNSDTNSNQNENITCVTNSKLQAIRRNKKSVDEEGNVLPFIVKENKNTLNTTELVYSMGVCNFYSGSDGSNTYVDVLKKITVVNDSNVENKLIWEYIKVGNEYKIKKNNSSYATDSNIACNDFSGISNGKITFEYILGALLKTTGENKVNVIDENSGIFYRESYDFSKRSDYFNLIDNINNTNNSAYEFVEVEYEGDSTNLPIKSDDKNKNENVGKIFKDGTKYYQLLAKYTFIDINYESGILNEGDNKILTNASFNENLTLYDNFYDTNIFKLDTINDIEEFNTSIDLNIERGISSAYERHHILFEINSIADLENYRNNVFKI